MARSNLRLISSVFLILLVLLLKFFSKLEDNVIVSIALILIFLILFTFIFNDEGPQALKIFIMLFSFMCLPLFILFYLGVFSYFSNPFQSLALALIVIALGALSLFAIHKLNYVRLKWE